MKYNRRIKQVAEEMARSQYPEYWQDSYIFTNTDAQFRNLEWEGIVNEFVPLATIAIESTTEAVRDVFSYIDDPGISPNDISEYLQTHGLIP